MIRKTAILVALLATFLCIASLSPFASAKPPCDHNVTVVGLHCEGSTTEGWFYNETGWNYSAYCGCANPGYHDHTPLFHLRDNTVGEDYYGFCINYTVPINASDIFNASIYTAAPTCKNNSIAYILNNWTIDIGHCDNVSAGQSAVWYFWYIDEPFCRGGEAEYNHTAEPPVESYWIPNCTAHPEACTFINASINKSVPYAIEVNPNTGSYAVGAQVELQATVSYCLEDLGQDVTVVFETDAGTFSENGLAVYKNETVNGKCNATLVRDTVGSANVTVRIEDMKWFEIVDPLGCPDQDDYQPTLRIINVTNDANFDFTAGEPDIGIDKLVDDVKIEEVTHNQVVTYKLTITNTGDVNLTDIMVVDTLPADITWDDNAAPVEDSVTPEADGTTTIVWKRNLTQFEPFKPGDSFDITFKAIANESAEYYELYRNEAVVNATSEWGDVGPESSYAAVYLDNPNKIPVLTPFGIVALIGLLSIVVILSMSKRVRKKKG